MPIDKSSKKTKSRIERYRRKLLNALLDWADEEYPSRAEMSMGILGFKTAHSIYRYLSADDIADIEIEVLRQKRRSYVRKFAAVDHALFREAEEGSFQHIKLVYERFEDWTPKRESKIVPGEGLAEFLTEIAGATRGLPNRSQEKIKE